MKSQKLKRKLKIELPYWPSAEFITKAIALAKKKGFKGTDVLLADMVYRAYWLKREELLASVKP